MKDVGRIFDRTLDHPIAAADTARFAEHYFPDGLAGLAVLDAGSRLGDYSAAFLAAGARRVAGVDVARSAVAAAATRWRGRRGLSFAAADLRRLPFADDSFDVAVCASGLSYLAPAQARRGLAELARVTRPGGVLLLLFLRPQGFLLRAARAAANLLPMRVYAPLVAAASRLPPGIATPWLGRRIDAGRLRYLLWGLQGTRFGVPAAIPPEHRVPTVETTDCSERTLSSFRVPVPADKAALAYPAIGR